TLALRALFARPFGPRALAEIRQRGDGEGDVYGVDREHAQRLHLLMKQAGESGRDARIRSGAFLLGGAAIAAGASAYAMTRDDLRREPLSYSGFVVGAVAGATGVLNLVRPSYAEVASDGYPSVDEIAEESRAPVYAIAENNLFVLAEGDRQRRNK